MDLKSILGWLRGAGAAGQGPGRERPVDSPAVSRQGPPAEPPPDGPAVEALLAPLRRRAIRMQVGGFRPPEGLGGSWFGRVNLALPGEEWPTYEGKPMFALAQIDLTQLPFRPPGLGDVEVITLFIDDGLPVVDGPNGDGWCLRAYPDRSALVPLAQVDAGSYITPFPMRPEIIEGDYPDSMEESVGVPELSEEDMERFAPAEGFKLGGWPFLVQYDLGWSGRDSHPARPEYVFQIDSDEKAGWMWGDAGIGYFGRGTRPGRTDEWVFTWQCY